MQAIYCRAFSIAANLRSSGFLPEGLAGNRKLLMPAICPDLDYNAIFERIRGEYQREYGLDKLVPDELVNPFGAQPLFYSAGIIVARTPGGDMKVSDAPSPVTLALAMLESGGVLKKVNEIFDKWIADEKAKGMSVGRGDRFVGIDEMRDMRDFLKADHKKEFFSLGDVDPTAPSPVALPLLNLYISRVVPFIRARAHLLEPGEEDIFVRDEEGRAVFGKEMEAAVCSYSRDMLNEYFHDMMDFADQALAALDRGDETRDNDENAPRT